MIKAFDCASQVIFLSVCKIESRNFQSHLLQNLSNLKKFFIFKILQKRCQQEEHVQGITETIFAVSFFKKRIQNGNDFVLVFFRNMYFPATIYLPKNFLHISVSNQKRKPPIYPFHHFEHNAKNF